MSFSKGDRISTLNGVFFVALFALASIFFARNLLVGYFSLSPLSIALVLGILYGNTLRHKLPVKWVPGVHFATKYILRLGIILYGFRITFEEIFQVGAAGLVLDTFTIISVFFLSLWLGVKFFKLDKDLSMLIGSGFAICGVAAVLATEGVLKSESYKATTAIATVVILGTISIFLYPFLHAHFLGLNDVQFGVYIGGTVHEVAQVIAIGSAISPAAEATALVVKMTRVMLLAPFLTLLGVLIGKKEIKYKKGVIPWFVLGFILVVGFNSLNLLSSRALIAINQFDLFLLAMSMAAIGMETNLKKIKLTGLKPIYLAVILSLWLIVSGYLLTLWLKMQNFI